MSGTKSAILLLAHGTPDSPADIPEFMRRITGGRPISDAVMQEITHRYSLVGKSPLTEITMRQAEALQAKVGLPVYVGMRNWKPFIADAVR
ncbi:MAG: ferrochelatase, partial [Terriglobales bacterium]